MRTENYLRHTPSEAFTKVPAAYQALTVGAIRKKGLVFSEIF